jgi:hypothetical protein
MCPTVFRYKNYRFHFSSREEPRMHIHVHCGHGEAKFWIEPDILLARNFGLTEPELRLLRSVIEERIDEIKRAWYTHFGH